MTDPSHLGSPHLTLRQLQIFRAVAESGSIRSASRQVHLTQPAVTHAVRELERSLGSPLFARSVKGVVPTAIGTALLRRTHLLFNEVRRTKEEIAQLRDGVGGRLCVAFSGAASQLLPEALVEFRLRRPGVVLELRELSLPSTDERWLGVDCDFALISELDDANDGFERELLLEQPLVVRARASHPQADTRSLRLLQQCTWLVPSYGPVLLRRLFEAQGLPPPTDVIACQTSQLAMTLLHRTDALAFMVDDPLGGGWSTLGLVQLPLPGPIAMLRITLLVPDARALTPVARLFIECLRKVASDV
ncbi:LysR family transcriptional regulator [Variovorax sp. J22P271]|uniref:LysR family transcriptional regulator n=1 Tax=Variovorax davisae TaxID=3053515 RepID=UPI0025763867|nr:LysR family transcriptional regulator [Variovorax sp. J22P271]MDM0033784.1 LysR family transcriptional regulator [Variovorax sp. J22P271]